MPYFERAPIQIGEWFNYGDQFLDDFKDELTRISVVGNHIAEGESPNFPLYIYQGTADDITRSFEDTKKLKDAFCSAATDVLLVPYLGGTHASTLLFGASWAMEWIAKIFDGEPTKKGCGKDGIIDLSYGELDALLFESGYKDLERHFFGWAKEPEPHLVQDGVPAEDLLERIEL
ncbi:hypothetical protein BBP40_008191 [Aspergillus hancockii]|nr:hypothetical protein BBP40_008191 [Aspergillus hancockii]